MKVIVLAGGRGTRLWPMSRELYSKQFLRLPGSSESLLASAYVRAQALVQPEDIITVTSQDFAFFVKDTFREVTGQAPLHVICEPVGRNTAPAIGLALAYARDKLHVSPEESFLVMTSDHVIQPVSMFAGYVKLGEEAAESGYLVTFGVKPTGPETGYGYVQAGEHLSDGGRYSYGPLCVQTWNNPTERLVVGHCVSVADDVIFELGGSSNAEFVNVLPPDELPC